MIHFLVEGPSEERLLQPWLSRVLKRHPFRVHPHHGKGTLDLVREPDSRLRGLLHQLPQKLRGFAASLRDPCDAVVVMVDADDGDCVELANSIRAAFAECAPALRTVVRVAVEETEAFYFGDQAAVIAAFPDVDRKKLREFDPDSIVGTWERFGEAIGSDGGNKTSWAERIGPHLTTKPARSRSPSFRKLLESILSLDECVSPTSRRRPFVHRSTKVRHGRTPRAMSR